MRRLARGAPASPREGRANCAGKEGPCAAASRGRAGWRRREREPAPSGGATPPGGGLRRQSPCAAASGGRAGRRRREGEPAPSGGATRPGGGLRRRRGSGDKRSGVGVRQGSAGRIRRATPCRKGGHFRVAWNPAAEERPRLPGKCAWRWTEAGAESEEGRGPNRRGYLQLDPTCAGPVGYPAGGGRPGTQGGSRTKRSVRPPSQAIQGAGSARRGGSRRTTG